MSRRVSESAHRGHREIVPRSRKYATICAMDEPAVEPIDAPPQDEDDGVCWVGGGPTDNRHCKIVCRNCGFTRDFSDP